MTVVGGVVVVCLLLDVRSVPSRPALLDVIIAWQVAQVAAVVVKAAVVESLEALDEEDAEDLLEMIEQKFGQFFDLDDENLELDLNEDALLRADPLTRYNLGRIGKLSGLVSTNEWRRAERMPPVDGGDEVMQPVNMAALGSNASGTAADGAGRPPVNQAQAQAGNAQDDAPEG